MTDVGDLQAFVDRVHDDMGRDLLVIRVSETRDVTMVTREYRVEDQAARRRAYVAALANLAEEAPALALNVVVRIVRGVPPHLKTR